MNAITLNLSTRPFRNNMVVGSVLAAVAAAVVLATLYNGYIFLNHGSRYEQVRQEQQQHLERLAKLETGERALAGEIQKRDFRRLYGRGQFAGELILKRAFSWTLLFNHLENVVPPEVMMTAIRPQITSQGIVIRVDGIAKNHDALYAFEDALQKIPVFTHVQPLNERKINPGRPEISFAMNFDYLPAKAVPGPAAIASAAVPGGAPAPAAAPAATAAASPGPSGGPAAPARTAVAGGAPAAVLGTVGRDGLPRTPETLARLMVAPGGFYPETPPSVKDPVEATKKPKGRSHDAKTASTPAPKDPAATAAPPPVPQQGSAPGTTPATWKDGANFLNRRPPLVPGLPARRDPSQRTRAGMEPGYAPPAVQQPVPASRLDVPLKFTAKPVGEVYAALGVAHGVTFLIDPAVDRRTTVTADLSGKNLKEALALVSKLAGHKVLRQDGGLYQVFPAAGGESMAEKPIHEEQLPPAQVHP